MKTCDFRVRQLNSASPSLNFTVTHLGVLLDLPHGQDRTTVGNLLCSESKKEPTITNNLTVESGRI